MSAPGRSWQLQFLALCLVWGSSFLLMMVGLRAFAPVQISALRILLGLAAVLVIAVRQRVHIPTDLRTWLHFQPLGLFLCTVPFTLFALSETRVSSALAGIGNAITPVAAVLLGLLMRTEEFPPRKLIGVAAGFAGVVLVLQPWSIGGRPDLLGFLMAAAGGTSYAVGWTYHARFLAGRADLRGFAQPAVQLLSGSAQILVVLGVWWWTRRDTLAAPWTPGSSPAAGIGEVLGPLAAVAVLGAVGTGLAFAMQFNVVRAVGPTVAATVTYAIPLVAIALGVAFLDEHIGAVQLLGAGIVVGSGVLVRRST